MAPLFIHQFGSILFDAKKNTIVDEGLRHTAIIHRKIIFKGAHFKMNQEKKQGREEAGMVCPG